MTIVDANVLLYAYNKSSPQQGAAAQWLTHLLERGETVGLPWLTIWAFIRISTNWRVWPNPLSSKQAFDIVRNLLEQPSVVVIQPGPRHAELLERLLVEHGIVGPMVTDAVLAALALENGASIASTDQDFRRFTGVRVVNPVT